MLRPLHDRVIVRPLKAQTEETRPTGLIVVQEDVKEDRGEVVAVSVDVTSVTVGATVLYNAYGGQKVKSGDEELLLLRDVDLLAVED